VAPRTGTAGRRKTTRSSSIPIATQERLCRSLNAHLSERWGGLAIEILVRFKGRFAYVAYRELRSGKKAPPSDAGPLPLFRLGFTGDPRRWYFSLFTYSSETYRPCLGASGSFVATPTQAFDCAARLYLS